MKALCERLVAKGVAYVAEGHVLFSPEAMNALAGRLPKYGKLANRSLDEMIAGARVDVAPYKRGSTDFVLWKPSADHEPGWPSPCGLAGKGRPGWHIECSAMSMATLLEPFGGGLACDDPLKNTFDIHGGGIDLVFPHHENEIAQSCCAFGSGRMANLWMHNGFLQVEGQKMSKSLGNFRTIREVLNEWPGEVARLAMLRTHYRQPIDWTEKALGECQEALKSWIEAVDASDGQDTAEKHPSSAVIEALADDLNTAQAIAALHGLARDARSGDGHAGAELAASLGLLGFDVSALLRMMDQAYADRGGFDEAEINAFISARLAARAAKNWAESDRIRDELAAMGIQLKDGKDEAGNPVTFWEVKR